tara:strand:- start:639 stop:1007 length:369 start_codon:yes stop_codon:yes gene_type:complete
MLGTLIEEARKLTISGHAAPEQQEFLQGVGKLTADAAQWPEEDFTFEDGVVYVILDRLAKVDQGMPLMASSVEAAEKYCRKRCDADFGEGKYMFTDKSIGGVTAFYANGTEVFNLMPQQLVG